MSPLDVLLTSARAHESRLREEVGRLELAAEADSSLQQDLEAATASWQRAISTSRRLEARTTALARHAVGRAA